MNQKNIIATLVLAVCSITAAWAQTDLTPNETKTVWTLASMPAYDIELQAEYYTDLDEDIATEYTPLAGKEIDVWIERTLQSGSYNTFALPFGMSLADFKAKIGDADVKVKALTDATVSGNTLTLIFSDATEIEACTPYLVKLSGSENVKLGAFDEVVMPSSVEPKTVSQGGVIDFVATLGKSTPTASRENILFVGANNTLRHPSADGQNIKGFRAYFELKGTAQNAQSFSVDFGEGVPTAIEVIDGSQSTVNSEADACYSLNGTRINGEPAQKGVYIKNGKKTIIK